MDDKDRPEGWVEDHPFTDDDRLAALAAFDALQCKLSRVLAWVDSLQKKQEPTPNDVDTSP